MEIIRIPASYFLQLEYLNEKDFNYVMRNVFKLCSWDKIQVEKSLRWWLVYSIFREAVQMENKARAKKWKEWLNIDLATLTSDTDEQHWSEEMCDQETSNQVNSNQNKSKQNKENIIYFSSEKLNLSFLDYLDNRKKIKKPATEYAINLLVIKIEEWQNKYTENEIIEFISLSIENNRAWIFDRWKNTTFSKPERELKYCEKPWVRDEFDFFAE